MSLKAVVSGGGLAGLACAAALARRGWSVRVYERSNVLREIGAGIYLHQNSLVVLQDLGLLSQVDKLGVRIRPPSDDSAAVSAPGRAGLARPGDTLYTIARPDLHRLLATACHEAGIGIVTGCEVNEATADGRVVLGDGTSVRADLVIAADGVNSRIREGLRLTRRRFDLPEGATRLLVRRGNATFEREGWTVSGWSGRTRMMMVPCSPEFTYICLMGPDADGRCRRTPIDVKYWSRLYPQFSEFFHLASKSVATRHRLSYVEPRRWTAGCTALLGDAAHGQPPTLAQGAGLAIANAGALASYMDQVSSPSNIPVVLRKWEQERRPAGLAVQRTSLSYALVTGYWPAFAIKLRAPIVSRVLEVPRVARHWDWALRGGTDHETELRETA